MSPPVSVASADDATGSLIGQIAEEFSQRLERGEQPTIDEYASRYPDHAVLIRDILSTLLLVEEVRPDPHRTLDARFSHRDLPSHLGDFRLGREVGRGGMGIVHEAEQLSLKRRVALKIVPGRTRETQQGSSADERFRREGEAAARLQHPHIVPVFACGSDQGFDFYAMQFVEGISLSDLFAQPGRLIPEPWTTWKNKTPADRVPATVRMGVQIAGALQHAHERGVLHRDVKPANILVDTTGHPWLADFGLARLDEGSGLTGTGDLLGTLRYMAPERFRGWADPRSDVYALGLTLYEVISGQLVYRETDQAQLIQRITQEELPPLRKLTAEVPRDLETVLQKATAREPSDRYASASEFAADLQRILDGRPIAAVRLSPLVQVSRWARRNPLIASLAGLVAVLLVALTVGALFAAQYYRSTAEIERNLRVRAVQAEQGWRRESANANRSARIAARREFEAIRELAHSTRTSGATGQQVRTLELIREALALQGQCEITPADREQLRQEAIAALSQSDFLVKPQAIFPEHDAFAPVEISPAFDLVAISERPGIALYRWPEKSKLGALTDPEQRVFGPRSLQFNRDATHLLADYGSELLVWNVASKVVAYRTPRRLAGGMRIHPTEPWLCLSQPDKVSLVRWTDGSVLGGIPASRLHSERHMAISPEGQRLALSANPGMEIWDLTTRRQIARNPRLPRVNALAWTQDGKAVLATTQSNGIVKTDAGNGRSTTVVLGEGGSDIAVSSATDSFVVRGTDNRLRLWDQVTGKQLCSTALSSERLGFDATGRWIAPVQDGTKWAMAEVVPRQTAQRLDAEEGVRTVALAFDPTAQWLAIVQYSKGVKLWNLATRTFLAEFPCPDITDGAFLPEGRGLVVVRGFRIERWPVRDGSLIAADPELLYQSNPGGTRTRGLGDIEGFSADGRFVILEEPRSNIDCTAHVIDPRLPLKSQSLGGVRLGVTAMISPDGQWAVTRAIRSPGVDIHDLVAKTKHSLEMPHNKDCLSAVFSPKSDCLLATTVDAHHLFRSPSWSLESSRPRQISSSRQPAWSFDRAGEMSVHCDGTPRFEVRRFPSGDFLAAFNVPSQSPIVQLAMSPDGSLVATYDGRFVELWDLRKTRRALASLNLDWPGSAFEPSPPSP